MVIYRTRQLISEGKRNGNLSYSLARKKNMLGKKALFNRKVEAKGGKYPKRLTKNINNYLISSGLFRKGFLTEYVIMGWFMEYFIKYFVELGVNLQSESVQNLVELVDWTEVCSLLLGKVFVTCSVPSEGVEMCMDQVAELDGDYFKDRVEWIMSEYTNSEFLFEQEIEEDVGVTVQGHPDLLIIDPITSTIDVIVDVKMTGQFNKMKKDCIFQLITYLSLYTIAGRDVGNKIGLYLPAQRKLVVEEVVDWNVEKSKKWMKYLCESAGVLSSEDEGCGCSSGESTSRPPSPRRNEVDVGLILRFNNIDKYVGHHISVNTQRDNGKKCKGLYESLPYYYNSTGFAKPCQFYIGGNMATSLSKTNLKKNKEGRFTSALKANKSLMTIRESGLGKGVCFVHLPCTLQVGWKIWEEWVVPRGLKGSAKKKCPKEDWLKTSFHTESLRDHITFSKEIGVNGCVIHCGNANPTGNPCISYTPEECIENMYETFDLAITEGWATKDCPLLLETCCKAGTEVLGDFTDFVEFAARFIIYDDIGVPKVREGFGVVLDTCHVWVADHDPFEWLCMFISYFENLGIEPTSLLKFVHYNDSQPPRGAKRDRHARIGTGTIPLESLVQVGEWCIVNNVPMVYE